MSGCPNGCSQHHIANIGFYGASIKVGGQQIPAYVAHVGGHYEDGEVDYGHAPEGAPARQARARSGRALAAPLRGQARATARSSTRSSSASARASSRTLVQDLALPVEFSLETMNHVHRLEPPRALPGRPGRGRVRGLEPLRDAPDLEDSQRRGGARLRVERFHPRLSWPAPSRRRLGDAGHAAADRARGALLHARHRRPVPGDLRDLARARGALRHQGRGLPRHQRSTEQRRLHGDELWERDRTTAAASARSTRCTGRSRASTPGSPACAATSRRRAPTRKSTGTPSRALEGQPAGGLDRADVWNYISENDVPYNTLHDQGYSSIGCTHCTLPGEAARAAGPEATRPSAACTADLG